MDIVSYLLCNPDLTGLAVVSVLGNAGFLLRLKTIAPLMDQAITDIKTVTEDFNNLRAKAQPMLVFMTQIENFVEEIDKISKESTITPAELQIVTADIKAIIASPEIGELQALLEATPKK